MAPIEVQDGVPVLDEYGNVVGGLRSPFLDVPTSTWNGSATGASFCFIAGWEDPFAPELLADLYPSHRSHVARVTRSTAARVAERVITAPDGLELVRDAAASDIP